MSTDYWDWKHCSVGIRAQTDMNTPAATGSDTDWGWIVCQPPEWGDNTKVEADDLANHQVGAMRPPVVGGADGTTVKLTGPLRAQLTDYDPTSDTPGLAPEWELIAGLMGASVAGAYAGAAFGAGSDARAWDETAGSMLAGSFYACGASAAAIRAAGFHQDAALGLMFNDAIAVPVSGDNLYPGRTIYFPTTAVQPGFWTLRHVGDNIDFDRRGVGFIPTGAVLIFKPEAVPTFEITGRVTAVQKGGAGGLRTPIDYHRYDAIMGEFNSRFLIGQETTGTANAMGDCDIDEIRIEIGTSGRPHSCAGGLSGKGTYRNVTRWMKATFDIAHGDDITTGATGETIFHDALKAGSAIGVEIVHGAAAGKLLGVRIPGSRVSAKIEGLKDNDGIAGWGLELTSGNYAGDDDDGGGDAAANAPAAIGLG